MPKFDTPIQLKDDEELVLEVRHYFLMFLPHLIFSIYLTEAHGVFGFFC